MVPTKSPLLLHKERAFIYWQSAFDAAGGGKLWLSSYMDGHVATLLAMTPGKTRSGKLLNIRHQLTQGFDIVLRMHRAFEAAQLFEVGGDVFRAEAFVGVEADAQ